MHFSLFAVKFFTGYFKFKEPVTYLEVEIYYISPCFCSKLHFTVFEWYLHMQNMLLLCTSMIFGPSMGCFCIFYHLPGKLPRLIDLQAAQFVHICSTNSASLTKVYFLGFVQITSMNSVVVLVIMIIA